MREKWKFEKSRAEVIERGMKEYECIEWGYYSIEWGYNSIEWVTYDAF